MTHTIIDIIEPDSAVRLQIFEMKDSYFRFKITKSEKARYVAAAKARGVNLSKHMRAFLEREFPLDVDWEAATRHLNAVHSALLEKEDQRAVDWVITPLRKRYDGGERSEELYQSIMILK